MLKHTILHEMLHGLGALHTTTPGDLMLGDSPNWRRDGALSEDAKLLIKIHNQ